MDIWIANDRGLLPGAPCITLYKILLKNCGAIGVLALADEVCFSSCADPVCIWGID
jgi:hypothetical protein